MTLSAMILSAILLSASANAAVLTLDAGPSTKEGVNISVGGKAVLGADTISMTTIGSGVRLKKVFFNVKVYVAQLLVGELNKGQFDKSESGALTSLDQQNAVAMHLTFLRDVPLEKLVGAFEEGFDANGVNMSDPDIMRFMELVNAGGAGEQNGTLTVFMARGADGKEHFTYEVGRTRNTYSGSMIGTSGLAKKVFALWLGVPADDFLAQLKTELLN